MGVIIGSVNIGEPSADTVDGTKIIDDAVNQEHVADCDHAVHPR